MIISIINSKGGVGKTTLSINLAHSLILRGFKTLIIDADTQGSARDWNAINEGKVIPTIGLDRKSLEQDIKSLSGFDYMIIDSAPNAKDMAVAAIKCSSVVLIPVQPSALDVWAASDLVALVKERQVIDSALRAAFVVNRRIQGSSTSKDIRTILADSELSVFKNGLHQRVAYSDSLAIGKTVQDVGGKARHEVELLVDELLEFIKND